MPKGLFSLIYVALALTFCQPCANAQKRHKADLKNDIPLPLDFALDYQLGLSDRAKVRGDSPLLENTALNETGGKVFSGFVQNPSVAALNLPYRWSFTIVNDNSINASSLSDGEVSVGSGLAKLMGTNSGLWAAALSHETEHVARRHAVRKYLYDVYVAAQLSYYQSLVRAGDKNANWSIVGLRIAAPIARAKLSRNLEHDADIQGMMLMAHEGYHPDFVFALHHLVRTTSGEQSKFAAFFSSHPRWETRDQRDDKAYADALAEFDGRWPDPSVSPGGTPPTVAFVGKATAIENKQAKTADLTLPIYCRNAVEPLTMLISFEKDNHPLQSTSAENRDEKGNLVFRRTFECSEKTEAIPVVAHLPASLVGKDDRKVKALVYVFSSNGTFVESFKPFAVHFPKP
ncbi:MAG TPA: M48 family metalloprotease [Candidatus Dormibacteraeota bacterium]|nr:M48 family metalloprotease [Candidatus Dormibacteraeota bacterium]